MPHSNTGGDPVLEVPANYMEEEELEALQDSTDVDKLRSVLEDDEVVYRLVLGFRDESDGVLVATNKRILFVDKKFVSTDVESFLYQEVAALIYLPQVVSHSLTLAHSERTLTITKVDAAHAERFIEFVGKSIGGDYSIEADGHVFRHNDEMLQIEDVPRLNTDLADEDSKN